MFCKNCGKENDSNAKFCAFCGCNLGEEVKEEATTAEEPKESTENLAVEETEKTVSESNNELDKVKEKASEIGNEIKEKISSVDVGELKEKASEIGSELKEKVSNIDVDEVKDQAKNFAENEVKNYKNFKNLSLKQKIIRIAIPLFIFIFVIVLVSGGGSKTPKVIKSGDNYVFDITYDDFCKEMAEVFSAITGASEDAVITYCNEIPAYDDTLDYYSGNLIRYEIGLESSTFSNALFVLKVEVYVEPKTEKVVTVSIFKANGSSTLDNFNMLANKASLILSGRIVGEMDDCLVKTIDQGWQQIHYFEYEGCGMEFHQQKSDLPPGGDSRRLNIYPAESFEIPE